MTQKMTLLLPDSTNDRLVCLAFQRRENRCDTIRMLLEKGLTELEENEKASQKKSQTQWTYRGHS